MTVRVLVVDDHELLRAGLVTVLESDPGIEVVGLAGDGPTAVRMTHELRPDIVLMDVEMPGGDGITATARLREELPGTRVLILTMFDLDDYVTEALRAGASGFLIKTTDPHDLVARVHACADGDTTLSPTIMERLIDTFVNSHNREPVPAGVAQLTDRERDVLRAMSGGMSNAEIARHLCLAETTVKTHVARILAKLDVRDRVQAVVVAHRFGLAG